MNDEELKKLLDNLEVPEPDRVAQKRAVDTAMEEFAEAQKKNQKNSKGISDSGRLTYRIFSLTNFIGGLTMKKRQFVAGALVIGVSAIAFMSVVDSTFTPESEEEVIRERISGIETKKQDMGSGGVVTEDSKNFGIKNKEADAEEHVLSNLSENRNDELGFLADEDGEFEKAPPAPAMQPALEPPARQDNAAGLDMAIGRSAVEVMEEQLAHNTPLKQKVLKSENKPQSLNKRRYTTITAESDSMIYPIDPPSPYYRDEGRDKFEEFKVNPVKSVQREPVSTFSIDVDTTSYSFIRNALNRGQDINPDSVRVEEMINYFDYDYAVPEDKSEPFKPTVAVYQTPWNADTKLMHIGIKGYELTGDKPRSNLVFLIDVSGSMDSPDKLPLLKNSLKMLLDTLDEDDTVALVTYAGHAGVALEPTSVENKRRIISAINRLGAGGSTAGAQGIKTAYDLAQDNFDKEAVNRVILATDGDFNVGTSNPDELKRLVERKRKSGIFLSVLGFGSGNYNDHIMQSLAQNGNGNAAYIDNLNEARKVLVDEASSTLFPIAKDVKIQVEFNPLKVSEYRLIGYETRALKREDFNNDRIDAGDIGAGHTVTAIYEIATDGGSINHPPVDDLRYQKSVTPSREVPASETGEYGNEYAFLKMRYKLPDEDKSNLITRPITNKDVQDAVGVDIRFAAAVAAFGQLLHGDSFIGDFSYDDIIELAESGRGHDKFGYRSEFINLVRLAKNR